MRDVDFHSVSDEHLAVHELLENWARWCFNRGGSDSHPMFRWAKPAQHWDAINVNVPVNTQDAARVEKEMFHIPEKPRVAIRWSYVYQGPPRRCANELGVTLQGLADLVYDGRSMLSVRLTDKIHHG